MMTNQASRQDTRSQQNIKIFAFQPMHRSLAALLEQGRSPLAKRSFASRGEAQLRGQVRSQGQASSWPNVAPAASETSSTCAPSLIGILASSRSTRPPFYP